MVNSVHSISFKSIFLSVEVAFKRSQTTQIFVFFTFTTVQIVLQFLYDENNRGKVLLRMWTPEFIFQILV